MLTFLKKFLSLKPRVIPEPTAPYKVEAPVPASAEAVKTPVKCGCGRSSSGECVGLHALTADQWATSDKNLNKVVAETAPYNVPEPAATTPMAGAAKASKAKKAPAAKAKTARKPRAPKAQ